MSEITQIQARHTDPVKGPGYLTPADHKPAVCHDDFQGIFRLLPAPWELDAVLEILDSLGPLPEADRGAQAALTTLRDAMVGYPA